MTTVRLTGQLVCATDTESETVARLLPAHVALTLAEPGCLSFEVVRTTDALVWQVDEQFSDEGAFAQHRARVAASDWGRATATIERRYRIDRP